MKTKITGKDILVTIAVLVLMFVGVPFLLWGISSWRLAGIQRNIEPNIHTIVESHKNDAQKSAQLAWDKIKTSSWEDLTQQTLNRRSWQMQVYDENTRTYKPTIYADAIQAIQQSCANLRTDLNKKAELDLTSYFSGVYRNECSFIFKINDHYVEATYSGTFDYSDPVDTDYIKKLTTDSSALPINIHRDGRTFHVIILLQKDPLMVWQFRVQTFDQPNNVDGKGDYP